MTIICIFGAGAIGGYIAASLKKTDAEISLIARGPHKKAIEEKGLTFIKNGKSENFEFNVTDDPKKLSVQDYIFISVKAHSISNIVDTLSPMINEQTSVISAVNGLPWWYFYKANTGTDLDDKLKFAFFGYDPHAPHNIMQCEIMRALFEDPSYDETKEFDINNFLALDDETPQRPPLFLIFPPA